MYFGFGLMVTLALAFSAQAQKVRQVRFQKGKTTIAFKGGLPGASAGYDAYIVRARKGQTLSFRLITDEPDAYVMVFESELLGPDEDLITPENEDAREWSGKVPLTSKYSVQVYGTRNLDKKITGKTYTLEISVL